MQDALFHAIIGTLDNIILLKESKMGDQRGKGLDDRRGQKRRSYWWNVWCGCGVGVREVDTVFWVYSSLCLWSTMQWYEEQLGWRCQVGRRIPCLPDQTIAPPGAVLAR
eukprot:scaffold2135_cov46-Attheya_sp.AAC.4